MDKHEYSLQAALYANALCRWLESKSIAPEHFGGALYIFVRAFTTGEFREGSENIAWSAQRPPRDDISEGVFFMDTDYLSSISEGYGIGAPLGAHR